MMEFYAQELWIFLIYNVRGSLLSCLLLRLVAPRPKHTASVLCPCPALCSTSCHRDHSWLAPPGSCQALGPCGRERLATCVCKPSRSSGPGASSRCSQSQLVLVPSLPWALHTGPAPLSRPPGPHSAVTEARPSYLFRGGLGGCAGAREHLPEKYIS